jgi:hypothetical protein
VIWSKAFGRSVRYGGDDLVTVEQRMKTMLLGWHALDLLMMFQRYETDSAAADAAANERLTALVGRAPRSYGDFACDAAAQWAKL